MANTVRLCISNTIARASKWRHSCSSGTRRTRTELLRVVTADDPVDAEDFLDLEETFETRRDALEADLERVKAEREGEEEEKGRGEMDSVM